MFFFLIKCITCIYVGLILLGVIIDMFKWDKTRYIVISVEDGDMTRTMWLRGNITRSGNALIADGERIDFDDATLTSFKYKYLSPAEERLLDHVSALTKLQ